MYRIVIVDDEFIVVEGIKAIIQKRNLDCEVVGSACDGSHGLQVVLEQKPDILITDIRMPGMDGFSLIEAVKKKLPDVSYIMISGYTEFEYARRAIGLGVKDYIDKPITIEKVEDAIHKIQKEDNESRENIWHADYKHIIDSIIEENPEELKKETVKILEVLEKKSQNLTVYKGECFHFICVTLEVFADKNKVHDNQMFATYSKLESLTTKEEVVTYVKNVIGHIAGQMEAEKVGTEHVIIKKLLVYINENYMHDIGLQDLADQVDMNSTYLSILFKDEVGMSYVKYLTNLRMNKARTLLDQGLKVNVVSERVGYINTRYFSDIFKKHNGMTPNEFRNRKKN